MSVKYAVINASTLGSNTVVAGVTNKKIRVIGYTMSAAGAVAATWKANATNISGPITMATGVPVQGVYGGGTQMAEWGIMETSVGDPLVLSLGSAVQIGGHLVYREVQV